MEEWLNSLWKDNHLKNILIVDRDGVLIYKASDEHVELVSLIACEEHVLVDLFNLGSEA